MNIIKFSTKSSKAKKKQSKFQLRIKEITMCFFLLGSFTTMNAQLLLQEHHAYKVSDGQLKVRWEPKNSTDWFKSKTTGYKVDVYNITNGRSNLISTELIKPASVDDWIKHESKTADNLHNFAVGARELIYPDSEENKFDQVFELNGDKARGDRLALGFLMYSASYDFKVAKLAGLGYELKYDPNIDYRFKIYSADSDPIAFDVIASDVVDPELPSITEEWNNMKVDVTWNSAGFQKYYLGYMVSTSDDGLMYTSVNGKPITNSLGLVADSSGLLNVTYTDSLLENNKTYWYKIQGFDYFGELSKNEYVFAGQGFKPIGMSPMIEYATQSEDNHGELRWYMPEEYDELVSSYRILRADTEDGNYEVVMDAISKNTKEVRIPLEHTHNHFKIEAVPYRGRPVGSFSVFIMGQDNDPPAMPEVVGAFIDSLGQVVKFFTSYAGSNIRLNLTDITMGFYYLEIKVGEEIYSTQKLIIVK